MPNDKELLRLWLKSKRMGLGPEQVEEYSSLITKTLIDFLNWSVFKNVHCYQAIESLNEPSTEELLGYLNEQNVTHVVQEQTATEPDITALYDLVIVPTLGFDLRGNRMGWGGGFYDRFLTHHPKALKVGLCYESGLVRKGIPAEPHDIRLDFVVTEKMIHKFKPTSNAD